MPESPESLEWMKNGACAGLDPALFYPERGDFEGVEAAKAVCASCVVLEPCAEYAVRENIRIGVIGGLSEKQRRTIRSQRRQSAS